MSKSKIAGLKKEVAPYEKSNTKTSIRQLINTLLPLPILWLAAYYSLSVSYWLTLLIAIPTAGFVVRAFIIQHDCGHGSFFNSQKSNDALGMVISILTLLPYLQWKNEHNVHHATSGNLDKRGIGDIWIMTVDEYRNASGWTRLFYRFYRHPLVMFGLGPIAIFLVSYRFNRKGAKRKEKLNTYIMNVLMASFYTTVGLIIGWEALLLVQGPIFFMAAAGGIWLFYVQHQFEDTYFETNDEWNYVRAAVEGSSYYKLPRILQWLSGNIGFHHVHHLSPRVPNYNLEQAHNDVTPLHQAVTLTFRQSLAAIKFRLWDEEQRRFISFRELKQQSKMQMINKVNKVDPITTKKQARSTA